ncbi:MAG: methionine--tRNA ligase subunit beta [Candidatus Vogelbacteria bacterium]|nr:methionine--tRNA ligase subunit beta [Candidatus Vogelbacteria bacterium]
MLNTIPYDDFARSELKIVQIKTAERVEGSEKLLKIIVDDGSDTDRQIISGIGKYYDPAELLGKQVVIVTNLEPRMLMGLESQGMLLAASAGETLALLTPDQPLPPGSNIK